jgi:hypothetical protein
MSPAEWLAPVDWDGLPREDLLRRIDGLDSHLMAVFERAAIGRPTRLRSDDRGSLAGCTLSTRDLSMIRRALVEYVGTDPCDQIDLGPISSRDPI